MKRKDKKGRLLREGESQRSDGQYMYRYVDMYGVRKSVYSWRLVETDALPTGKRRGPALRTLEQQIDQDINDAIRTCDADTTTVNDLFDSFMAIRIDLKLTTRSNYMCLYNKHIRNGIGCALAKSIKHTDIQRLYSALIKNGLKASSVYSVHAILYQLFENAVMDGIIRSNPTRNAMKVVKRTNNADSDKRHALTVEEQERFVNYVYSTKRYRKLAPLFTVLLGTGLRISEALGLTWKDCDFNQNLIRIDHSLLYKPNEDGKYEYRISTPKTLAGVRTVPMLQEVKDALVSIRDSQTPQAKKFKVDGHSGFIFLNSCNKVYTPSFVCDTINSVSTNYNKEEIERARKEDREPVLLPKFSPHILRHTFCTRMSENKSDIKVLQDVMGHRHIKTTMDVYNEATTTQKYINFKDVEGKMKLA